MLCGEPISDEGDEALPLLVGACLRGTCLRTSTAYRSIESDLVELMIAWTWGGST